MQQTNNTVGRGSYQPRAHTSRTNKHVPTLIHSGAAATFTALQPAGKRRQHMVQQRERVGRGHSRHASRLDHRTRLRKQLLDLRGTGSESQEANQLQPHRHTATAPAPAPATAHSNIHTHTTTATATQRRPHNKRPIRQRSATMHRLTYLIKLEARAPDVGRRLQRVRGHQGVVHVGLRRPALQRKQTPRHDGKPHRRRVKLTPKELQQAQQQRAQHWRRWQQRWHRRIDITHRPRRRLPTEWCMGPTPTTCAVATTACAHAGSGGRRRQHGARGPGPSA